MSVLTRNTKIGLLLIGANRFRPIGTGTANGTYEERQNRIAERLLSDISSLGDVTYTEIVYNNESMQKTMDSFYLARVDYVLVIHMSWAEDFGWIRFLRDMPPVPVLFASLTKESIGFSNTYDDDSFCELLVSNGLVGSLEASGSINRFKRPMMDTVAGTLETVMKKAKAFGEAAKCRGILRESTFGLLGPYNEVMWSTYVDPYMVFKDVGPVLHFYSVTELVQMIEKVSDSDADTICKKLAEAYEMGDGINPAKFKASVRASIGFDRLCEAAGVDCMVLNDIDNVLLKSLGLRPGFVWCTGNPTVVVPEGDIGSGIAVYVLKVLSHQQVNYIEPFYIEHDKQRIAVAHGGPNEYMDSKGKCLIGNDVRYAKSDLKYAGAPIAWYTFPPGDKTLLHVSQVDGKFKVATAQVEALETEHFMTSYSHGRIRPVKGSCEALIDKLIRVGVTQHYGMVEGDYTAELEQFAALMGYDFFDLND